jgi:hypothetical protein
MEEERIGMRFILPLTTSSVEKGMSPPIQPFIDEKIMFSSIQFYISEEISSSSIPSKTTNK